MKYRISIILLLLINFAATSQTEEIRNRQRAIFLFNFTRQIGWPEPFETFKIGVLGEDPVKEEIQRLISRGRQVQNKPVELVHLDQVSDVQNIQLVYVNEKSGHSIDQLLKQVSGKGILIVSENYPFNSSMINMVLVNGSFEFEIQQSRLEDENFELTSYFKDVAITSANRWQALYEQSTKTLEKEREKLAEQRSIIEAQEQEINVQSQRIALKTNELSDLQSQYDELTRKSLSQQELFDETARETALLEERLKATEDEIDLKQSEIGNLDSTLNAKQREISDQSKQIDDQDKTLQIQRQELDYQKNFTILFVGITVLSIITIFFIWKNNREKRKSNNALAQKNIEIEATSKELRMVNKEMEQFAYLASHDLQEPLNTITGWLQIINSEQLDENGKMSVDLIGNATDRMRSLIKGLLEYSKLGSHIEFKSVDCNELIKEILNSLTAVIEKKEAEIKVSNLPMVQGHQLKLSMLFQNLISNSLKFTKEGTKPIVQISARKSELTGYWEFALTDNGIGISEENLDKIFDIFHREHSRDKYEGTGIGLAHVKKIVEMHKGKIWVSSKLNEGTTFHFTLQQDS